MGVVSGDLVNHQGTERTGPFSQYTECDVYSVWQLTEPPSSVGAEYGLMGNGTSLRGNVILTRLPVVDIEKRAIL